MKEATPQYYLQPTSEQVQNQEWANGVALRVKRQKELTSQLILLRFFLI